MEKVERIEVTGSRIKRTDIETASPVQITSAEDIKLSGFTKIEDLMNSLPQIEASETAFLAKAAAHGAQIKNGLEMLYKQAEKAWAIWNK